MLLGCRLPGLQTAPCLPPPSVVPPNWARKLATPGTHSHSLLGSRPSSPWDDPPVPFAGPRSTTLSAPRPSPPSPPSFPPTPARCPCGSQALSLPAQGWLRESLWDQGHRVQHAHCWKKQAPLLRRLWFASRDRAPLPRQPACRGHPPLVSWLPFENTEHIRPDGPQTPSSSGGGACSRRPRNVG